MAMWVRLRPTLLIAALPVLVLGGAWGKGRADEAALAASGFDAARDTYPQAFFQARAADGLPPAAVARRMPPGATVERYLVREGYLLERYVYRRGVGRWPVHIYYPRGGGVVDVYAQDQWPGLDGARRVTAAEAERWRAGPG
jgi:hypothetical protein